MGKKSKDDGRERTFYSDAEIGRYYAQSGVGPSKGFDSLKHAALAVPRDSPLLGNLALVEIAARINQAIRAWQNENEITDGRRDGLVEVPDDATPHPDVKVGQVVYLCNDLDTGVGSYCVVCKTPEDMIQVVYLFDDDELPSWPNKARWACETFHTTREAAALAMAEEDLTYHDPRVRRANAVISAIKAGQPFGHLCVEIPNEADE